MGRQKVEKEMNQARKTLDQLREELRVQDDELRAVRARLTSMGDEPVNVDAADLDAIEEACAPRAPVIASTWNGIRC